MNDINNILLANNKIQKKLFHAYLLYGAPKEELEKRAKEFAKEMLCEYGYKNNCEKCLICKQVENNNYFELKIIGTEEKNIKIEEIKKLKYSFNKKTDIDRKRVYIINEAEKLTSTAANAMLKFIEEPEQNTYAILTTNNIEKILKTIRSRCREEIVSANIDSKKGEEQKKEIKEILLKIEQEKINSIYNCKEKIYDLNIDTEQNIFNIIMEIYLDYLHKKIKGINYLEKEYIMEKNSRQELIKKIEIADKFSERVKSNTNINMIFDAFIIEISEV